MSELRWILVGFGIVLLAAIYLWGRRGNRAAAADEPPLRECAPSRTMHERRVDADSLCRGSDRRRPPRTTSMPPDRAAIVRVRRAAARIDTWRGRVEPTFADACDRRDARATGGGTRRQPPDAPTLSSSEARSRGASSGARSFRCGSQWRRRRSRARSCWKSLLAESLQHGKYDIFHRLHADGSIVFSVASMVEPGTFDLEKMGETLYPGITLFAQLPGPVPGMHALNELVACARRLQANRRRHVAGRARRTAHRAPHRAHAPGSARVRASAPAAAGAAALSAAHV